MVKNEINYIVSYKKYMYIIQIRKVIQRVIIGKTLLKKRRLVIADGRTKHDIKYTELCETIRQEMREDLIKHKKADTERSRKKERLDTEC